MKYDFYKTLDSIVPSNAFCDIHIIIITHFHDDMKNIAKKIPSYTFCSSLPYFMNIFIAPVTLLLFSPLKTLVGS